MNPITDSAQQVVDLLQLNYPTVKIALIDDVKEGFLRPSFFINVNDDIKITKLNQLSKFYLINVDLIYYSTTPDNNKIENLNMIDSLSNIILSKIGNITISETQSTIVDGAVHCKFKMSFVVDIEDKDSSELMEYLYTTQL